MLTRSPRLAPGRLAEHALAGGLVLVLALVLVVAHGHPTRASDVLALLLAVIGAALAGCAARRARQAAAAIAEAEAARPIAEADRARTALLGAVSHDLRTPLAAAKAAVSCLRSYELPLTAQDHDDLLATADESLNLLNRLAADLLDMTRLQAGAVPVFPRPADLGEIIASSLAGLRPDVEFSRSSGDLSLWAEVISHARCAGSVLDPDDWFPVSPKLETARREANAAIAVCRACPVRAQCLELSLRRWDVGQHGVWGGLVPAERAELRRRWPDREGMG